MSKDLPITVTDIDEPDLVLSAASLEVLEDGEATYTVKLAIEPTSTVIVTVGGTTGTDPLARRDDPHLHHRDLEHSPGGDGERGR